jgi:hypothetical protein
MGGHRRHEGGLLADQRHLVGGVERVVRPDLGAEAVLQRRDDPSAVGVVLGIGRGDEQQVQRQPQRIAADLDVALLQHVEQRDLDPLGEVGQLVDPEDAAVRSGKKAVVHRLGITQQQSLGHLGGVDVAHQVADRRVRGGQLLGVALVAVAPCHRQVVAMLGREPAAEHADRGQRIVEDLGAGDVGLPLVQQPDQRAHQPRLALATLAEQHEVVAGEQRPFQLGQHGVVEPDDAGERRLPGAQMPEEVRADLVLDGAGGPAGGTQLAEGADPGEGCDHPIDSTPGRQRPGAAAGDVSR